MGDPKERVRLGQISAVLREDKSIMEFMETHLGIPRNDTQKRLGVALILLFGAKGLSVEDLSEMSRDKVLSTLSDSLKEFSKEALPDPKKYATKEGHAFYMEKFTTYLFESLESMQRFFRYNDLHLPTSGKDLKIPTKHKEIKAADPFFNDNAKISSCIRSVALHTEEHELNSDDLSDSARFYKNVHTGKVEEDRYHMILDNLSLIAALGNTAKGLASKDPATKEAYKKHAKNEALDYTEYFKAFSSNSISWDLHTGTIAHTHSLHPEMSTEEAQKELYKEHVEEIKKVFDRVKKTGLIDENTGGAAEESGRSERIFSTTGLDKTEDVKDLTQEQLDQCVKVFNSTFSVLTIKETPFFANSSSTERTVLDGFYINGVKAVDLAKDKMSIYPDDPKLKREDAHKEWKKLEPYVCALVLQSFAAAGGLSLTYKPFTPQSYKQDDSRIEKSDIAVKSEKPLLDQNMVKNVVKSAETRRIKNTSDGIRTVKNTSDGIRTVKNASVSINREEPRTIKNASDGIRTVKNASVSINREEPRTIKNTSVSINREEEKESPWEEEAEEKQKQFDEQQDKAAAFVNRVNALRSITGEIRDQLLAIKTGLEENGRINKKARFDEDGSTSYKAMAKALNKCIDLLGEDGQFIPIKRIAKQLQKLKNAGSAYMESHKTGSLKKGALAMIGKKNFYHAYGQARFNAAEKLTQMQALITDYSKYNDMESMSKLLTKSRQQIQDYELGVELEEEKDLGLNEEEDLTEEDEEEENNSILLYADKPKIMDHSKIIPIDQEKIGLMNEGLGKQEDLIRKSYSKKNSVPEEDQSFDLNLNKNRNRSLDIDIDMDMNKSLDFNKGFDKKMLEEQ